MIGNIEEIKTYECSLCDATFKYKKDLTVHTGLRHDKQANFQKFHCDQCDSKFIEKKSLNAHKKMKHTDNELEFPSQPTNISYVFTDLIFKINVTIELLLL